MKALPRILVVVLLAAAVAGVLALKSRSTAPEPAAGPAETGVSPQSAEAAQKMPVPEASVAASALPEGLPRLVELGADKCIPCKMMAPILDELKTEYAGKMEVQFIDVWKNPQAGEEYGIQLIPTQIFFDASGKELFRHTGFFPKEDILAAWKGLGFDFEAAPGAEPALSRWAPARPNTRPQDAYLHGMDEDGRPEVKALSERNAAAAERARPGGNVFS
ncbi:MAG: thioredoxin family protein [Candidatus Hydrogenedentales bacterium]|jgi:thioredoxin 1